MPKKICIIGTGFAGYLFAKEFRKLDTTTSLMMITQSDGDFYSKPLLSTALTHQKSPDQLPINNKKGMQDELRANIFSRWTATHIDANNKIVFCDDEQKKMQAIHYDQLILAYGAEKIQIPLQGDAVHTVLSINNLEAYRVFRSHLENKKNIAILGSGLVGCEFANDLVNAHFHVDVISPDVYPLNTLVPEQIGLALKNALQKLGVTWHLSRAAKSVDHKKHHIQITLTDESIVHADLVLSAVGIKPNLTLAKSANLTTHIGIVVNSQLQTSHPDIYALGDCAEINGLLSRHIAPILQAAPILAAVLTGKNETLRFPIMPIVVKTPSCPVVVVPPSTQSGAWEITGDNGNIRALFYDMHQKLRGFALCGTAVSDKISLVKRMNDIKL